MKHGDSNNTSPEVGLSVDSLGVQLDNAVLEVVQVFRVVDDFDFIGKRVADAGQTDVFLFDFLV